ncbi:type II toxin-antitoxin system RelE/ParE family toxin [Lonepinella koalarum]|uniref:type II toxin-antitoxin system RelE/ParE family toxin n=1 Tax=Lonepinella koalarum TaxID=53417 RepID=UPI003F6DBB5B
MNIVYSKAFKRDLAKFLEVTVTPEFVEVMYLLQNHKPLPEKYKDHPLKGNWLEFRDCHIANDLVLIYRYQGDDLYLARMNTHSEVFK